jgi:hypothetical protein
MFYYSNQLFIDNLLLFKLNIIKRIVNYVNQILIDKEKLFILLSVLKNIIIYENFCKEVVCEIVENL